MREMRKLLGIAAILLAATACMHNTAREAPERNGIGAEGAAAALPNVLLIGDSISMGTQERCDLCSRGGPMLCGP